MRMIMLRPSYPVRRTPVARRRDNHQKPERGRPSLRFGGQKPGEAILFAAPILLPPQREYPAGSEIPAPQNRRDGALFDPRRKDANRAAPALGPAGDAWVQQRKWGPA
jgi:hypothetical protein